MPRYQSQPVSMRPIASTRGQLFGSLASRLSAFSEQVSDELDVEMAKKAKEKGLIDAQGKTEITLRDGSTIADEAWNQGAIASHMSAVKLDINDNLSRIAAESTRDPEGYAVKAKAYSKGLLSGVPDGIKPIVQDELASIILKSGQKISSDLTSFNRDQDAATISTGIDLYRTDGENAAKEGDVDAATDAQLKAHALTNRMEAAGMITHKSAEIQRNNITRDIEDQVIYGAFEREMNAGRGVKHIERFKKLKRLGDRDPDYRKKMVSTMLGMMQKDHQADDAQRKRDDAARKARYRKGERKVASLDLEGALIPEHLQKMLDNDELDPKVADKYKKNAFASGPEFSDQIAVNEYKADLLGTTEFDIQTDPRLSRPDKMELIGDRRALEDDKGNWKGTQNGREGARRINHAFGIIKGAMGVKITPEKAQRAGMVLTRYFNEVENTPVEEREVKSIEVADRLVKEVNNEILIKDLDSIRERLNKATYQTEEQIKAAELGSEEEKTQIILLNRKLRRIERLEREIGQ